MKLVHRSNPSSTLLHRLSLLLVGTVLLTLNLSAQPLSVSIGEIDFSGLPRISFKACVEKDGKIVRGLDSTNFTLLENGVPHPVSFRCPDPDQINSVVLVLDNSGSIFNALPKLIEASKRLVDSLGPNDECAIITFGRFVQLRQDFTTDKWLLKQVLDGMVASGGTPLFDAIYEACDRLGFRSGNRHAVVITDGEDNLSQHTMEEVIDNANRVSTKLYTIAFDIDPQYQAIMETMAVGTGGRFFAVARPSELTGVYEKIADLITEKCCLAEYVTSRCPDTLRSLLLTVTHQSETASTLQNFTSPSRSLSALLSLDVPTELTPLATGMGYIDMTPGPSTELELNLSFTLLYDEDMVQIPLLPFTLGTVSQNQLVRMTRIGRGELRFELLDIIPAVGTTRLVGFPIEALVADSSRYVEFAFENIVIEGCPIEFKTANDSTLICQCFRPLDPDMDSLIVIGDEGDVTVPVYIASGLETGLGMKATTVFGLSPGLELVDVLNGSLLPDGALTWSLDDDILTLDMPTAVTPFDTSGVLAWLHLRTPEHRDVKRYTMTMLHSELWQRCCPEDGALSSITVIRDGLCNYLLLRPESPVTITNAPNPISVQNGSQTRLTVSIPESREESPLLVQVVDLRGTVVARIFSGTLPTGEHHFSFDASGLPSGRYLAVVRSGDQISSHNMLYVQ